MKTEFKGSLYFLGMGPGSPKWISPAVREVLVRCPQLCGSARTRESIAALIPEKAGWIDLDGRIALLPERLETALHEGDTAVLASGDVGAFSIAAWLRKEMRQRFPDLNILSLPGISSIQYFCAHLGLNWTEAECISLHGREKSDWLERLEKSEFSILLTDKTEHRAEAVLEALAEEGWAGTQVVIGEDLSYEEERWLEGSVEEVLAQARGGRPFRELQLIGVFRKHRGAAERRKQDDLFAYAAQETSFVPGLPDELFLRGERPMTKREVRAQILSMLQLPREGVFWDVGSGSGSVSVEMALAAPEATVVAIEQDAGGVELTRRNGERFGLRNLRLLSGRAEKLLDSLPIPERVFIGGSEGALGEIARHLAAVCQRGCRLVLSAVTLETPEEALRELRTAGFEEKEILQLQATRYRKAGRKHLAQAQNPVLLIAAELSPRSAEDLTRKADEDEKQA